MSPTTISHHAQHGLILARNHLKVACAGGSGRSYSDKVIILLTDGVPNLYSSASSTVSNYISGHPSTNYHCSASGNLPYKAPLMQAALSQTESVKMFPVGTGLGCDYGFMDRLTRLNGTAEGGQAPRGTGSPASYEATLATIFEEIIKGGCVRLAK